MKKTVSKKGLIAGVVTLSLAACLAMGCSSGSTSDNTSSASGEGFDMSAYPNHVAVSDGPDTLAGFHLELGYTCENCHPGDLDNEISIAGIEGEPELSSLFYTDTETCLSSGCHNSWESLAESTADLGEYNPHASIHGTIEYCNDCHKAHSPQIDTCGECHPNGGQEMLF